MKTIVNLLMMLAVPLIAQAQIPDAAIQIRLAVLAAPENQREGATVFGYRADGTFALLRQGTNEMVCLADDPRQEGFSVACYHKDLEPFMARGRELRAQGKSPKEVFDIREEEVKSGRLFMPRQPTMLFVYFTSADNYKPSTGEVKNAQFRYVVYVPYATAESTGLPLKPEVPGMPWLMDPGTHRAHIMINPPSPLPGMMDH